MQLTSPTGGTLYPSPPGGTYGSQFNENVSLSFRDFRDHVITNGQWRARHGHVTPVHLRSGLIDLRRNQFFFFFKRRENWISPRPEWYGCRSWPFTDTTSPISPLRPEHSAHSFNLGFFWFSLSFSERSHFHVSVNQISFFPFDGSPLVEGTPRDHVLRFIGWWNVTWLKKKFIENDIFVWIVTDISQVPPGGPEQEVPPVGLDTENLSESSRWRSEGNRTRTWALDWKWKWPASIRITFRFLVDRPEMMSVSQFGVHLASAWSTDACH